MIQLLEQLFGDAMHEQGTVVQCAPNARPCRGQTVINHDGLHEAIRTNSRTRNEQQRKHEVPQRNGSVASRRAKTLAAARACSVNAREVTHTKKTQTKF